MFNESMFNKERLKYSFLLNAIFYNSFLLLFSSIFERMCKFKEYINYFFFFEICKLY